MSDIYHRHFSITDAHIERRAADGDAGKDTDDKRNIIRMVASTDQPVCWGDWSEVLDHGDKSIDTSAARALLLNHQSGMIVGPIRSIKTDGNRTEVEAEILPDAKLPTGILVADAVRSGALRGVSIGYDYQQSDTDWDDKTRTLTVKRWNLREVTLTPIPADRAASVRSLPTYVSEKRNAPMTTTDDAARTAADAAAKEREAAAQAARELATRNAELAKSHGLDAAEFTGCRTAAEADSKILEALTKRAKEKMAEPVGVAGPAQITAAQEDKVREAAIDAMSAKVYGHAPTNGNPCASKSWREIARKFAIACGVRGAHQWEREDAAWFALGQPQMMAAQFQRDAANIGIGNFTTFVQLNAITKIVVKGFEQIPNYLAYPRITEANTVPDFKTYYLGAMGTANLVQVAENLPLPELVKAEGVYSNTAKMWGGTLSLTIQALVSDDTGQFDRSLRLAGAGLQKTIEKRVMQKLLQGTATTSGTSTWTNNTSSGCSLVYSTADKLASARGRLAVGRAALMNKVGLDGNPMGTMPRFLLCGPTREQEAAGIVYMAPGSQVSNLGAIAGLEVISTPWLESSALTGNSPTTYYLGGDPMLTTGLVLNRVAGFENPTVMEYDAGATASRKWKIFMPFEADLINVTIGANKIIPAWQQCTT